MIVSASYKTDIPAFYGQWFLNRLDAGFAHVENPWGGQVHEVRLEPDAVDGFVFWTRNAEPFLDALAEVRRRNYPFVVQYTLTAYPRALETSVPGPERAVACMRRLADLYGPDVVVWRYDPIVATDLTLAGFQVENFAALAGALNGITNEVVVSFAHIYRKTRRNLARAAEQNGFAWWDPEPEEKRALAAELARIAGAQSMRLRLCAQPEFVAGAAAGARCVDAERLSRVAGRAIRAPEKGNRPGCLCHESRDIGAYDTCPHGCVYCYAVSAPGRARARHRRHDPAGPFLFPPEGR